MSGSSYISANGHAEIPYGVDKIVKGEFQSCTNLKSITIPNTVTVIQSGAFEYCSSLTSIVIPDSVKKISRKCFSGCTSLTTVVLPKGLKGIGENTFNRCESLTDIIIPDKVESIGKYAFDRCTSLTSLKIPESVKEIGEFAFHDCQALKTLDLPKEMTRLGNHAFAGCTALERIDVPHGVKTIEPSVFSDCKSAHIHLPSTVTEFLPLKTGWYSPNEMKSLSVSPDNPVLSIEANCLIDKQKRELLHILPDATGWPADLKSINIPKHFFHPLFDVEELVIPEGVTYISALPFDSMKKLKKLVLPTSLRRFDKGFLEKCPLSSLSVTPDLLLSSEFEPWMALCRVDLIETDPVDAFLKSRIAGKFPVNRWTDHILCVYSKGELIHPSANLVKIKEEELSRKAEETVDSELQKQKERMTDRIEDITIDSLCKATFDPDDIIYEYSDYFNSVSVEVPGLLRLHCYLQMETAQDDLAMMKDIATSFRDALKPYVSADPDGTIICDTDLSNYDEFVFEKDGGKFISGKPFPNISVLLSVNEATAEVAYHTLENLRTTYTRIEQKYGDRLGSMDKRYFDSSINWYLFIKTS